MSLRSENHPPKHLEISTESSRRLRESNEGFPRVVAESINEQLGSKGSRFAQQLSPVAVVSSTQLHAKW
jgi:hypothetical protein